ncbi:hypothetical protein IQ250_28560 [Pseudanabaenaceae cyanobacterium LEGE 13415]|nr:hypothetical protein [Pseudanabaenaceae cyanobacterium LEGE 13415]
MTNKISAEFGQGYRLIDSQSFIGSLRKHPGWLSVLLLQQIGLGWGLWLNSCGGAPCATLFFFLVEVVLFFLLVATVRKCRMIGMQVWAGLLSLTFGSMFIIAGTAFSMGRVAWGIAIVLTWMSMLLMDSALSKSIENLLDAGLMKNQVLQILLSICTIGVFVGAIFPFLFHSLARI